MGKPKSRTSEFERIGLEIGSLVTSKNAAYGSAFEKAGDILRILFPNGVPPEKFTDMLAMVRVIDKLFRIATSKKAFGESPWRDIGGYSILEVEKDERNG